MREFLTNLNKHLESRVRLGVMSVLMVNEWADFSTLKDNLSVTDGNLASHIKALENEKYIEVKKQFLNKKPNTSYRATQKGKKSFLDHLNALEKLINSSK
jgi:DNA-binding HxlR family transcriptional regulator